MRAINHITLAVSNLEKSILFYRDILGLKFIKEWQTGAYFLSGNIWFALNLDKRVIGKIPSDYSHIAFSCCKNEFETLKKKLIAYGCRHWAENVSEGDSFYFNDPDGHQLEIHVGNLQSRLRSME